MRRAKMIVAILFASFFLTSCLVYYVQVLYSRDKITEKGGLLTALRSDTLSDQDLRSDDRYYGSAEPQENITIHKDIDESSLLALKTGDRVPDDGSTVHHKEQPESKQPDELSQLKTRLQQCLQSTHLNGLIPDIEDNAWASAKSFFTELRKVVPKTFLTNHSNPCWTTDYSFSWKNNLYASGKIGDIPFETTSHNNAHRFLPAISKLSLSNQFRSDFACMPKVIVAGFAKCGTTYIRSFITKLISKSLKSYGERETTKETLFWVHQRDHTACDVGGYIMNFVPGINQMIKTKRTDLIMVDGTQNMIFFWRPDANHNQYTNYCLHPTVLPQIIPNTKLVVMLRNPANFLYSDFWFSCIEIKRLTAQERRNGPTTFHNRIITKLEKFMNCLRGNDSEHDSICSYHGNNFTSEQFSRCFEKKNHLLDKCMIDILPDIYGPELQRCGNAPIAIGLFYIHIRKWLSIAPREMFLFATLEELGSNSINVAYDISDFIGIPRLSEKDIRILSSSSGKNNQHYSPMRSDTKKLLEAFYWPFNQKLAQLLEDDKFLWK